MITTVTEDERAGVYLNEEGYYFLWDGVYGGVVIENSGDLTFRQGLQGWTEINVATWLSGRLRKVDNYSVIPAYVHCAECDHRVQDVHYLCEACR